MKHKFIIKGKRGGILGSALSNFWAYITFIFVVLIFFVFFSVQRGDALDNRIESIETQPNLDVVLLTYLRTPIMDNGQEKIFADFIVETLIGKYPIVDQKGVNEIIEGVTQGHFLRDRRLIIRTPDDVCLSDPRFNCKLSRNFRVGKVMIPVSIDLPELKVIEVLLE